MWSNMKKIIAISAIAVLALVNVGYVYIINDQSRMYQDQLSDTMVSQQAITELSDKLEARDAEIKELKQQIPQ